MRDYKEQIDQLAGLMEEFKLTEASLNLSNFRVTFKRSTKPALSASATEAASAGEFEDEAYSAFAAPEETSAKSAPGNPVTSPMAGIYYISSSPSSPPFVKVGDIVTSGQTIGLIEAMKVFNEIPSPYAGTVLEILVESGGLVQPGDVILRIG